MTTLTNFLVDSWFLGSVVAWVVITFVAYRTIEQFNPLNLGNGFDTSAPRSTHELLYVLLISIPEGIILSWPVRLLSDPTQIILDPWLGVTSFTLVFALVLTARWFLAWQATVADLDTKQSMVRSGALFVALTFGLGIGVAVHTGTHLDTQTLQYLYQAHINFALFSLQQFQAILGLQLVVLQPFISETVSIFKNNVSLALRAGGLGVVGGVLGGLGIPLIMVMGVNAALIWGVFTGILIRNSIAVGTNVVLAPTVAYLSSMGLLIVGHTFHEFMGIIVLGLGGGFLGLGLVESKQSSVTGVKIALIGIAQIAVAALLEVWLDPRFIGALKGYISLRPTVLPLTTKSSYYLALGSVLVTTLVFAIVVTWMINITTKVIEGYI